jgi:hypothetical protein
VYTLVVRLDVPEIGQGCNAMLGWRIGCLAGDPLNWRF